MSHMGRCPVDKTPMPRRAFRRGTVYCSPRCKGRAKRARTREEAAQQRKAAKKRADGRAWYAAHREGILAARRAWYGSLSPDARKQYSARNAARVVNLAGETVVLEHLPAELREVALLVKEARKLNRDQQRGRTP